MILLQKPQPVSLSSPMSMTLAHRRQTSAPVVVVQPTRIPGILSLAKPPRSSPKSQQHRHHVRNAPKPSPASSTAQTMVRAPALTPTAPATPSPQSRGRVQVKQHPKEKKLVMRSVSQSPLRASGSGKHHGRQPSPPIPLITTQKSSQAEVPVKSTNPFDPFVDHSIPPSPSVQKQSPYQPSEPKVIPVPPPPTRPRPCPRSEPLPTRAMPLNQQQQPRPIPKRSLTIREFPICDDMSEVADNGGEPSTPIARRLYDMPLRTAPVSATSFNSNSISAPLPSSPKMKNGRDRKHRRMPSESGVFHMSSDEESSSGPGGVVLNGTLNTNVKALFGLFDVPGDKPKFAATTTSTPTKRDIGSVRMNMSTSMPASMSTSVEKAGFFASSMFQNSPSPDELPDPLLL